MMERTRAQLIGELDMDLLSGGAGSEGGSDKTDSGARMENAVGGRDEEVTANGERGGGRREYEEEEVEDGEFMVRGAWEEEKGGAMMGEDRGGIVEDIISLRRGRIEGRWERRVDLDPESVQGIVIEDGGFSEGCEGIDGKVLGGTE
ncbi:hypothetical protein Tco_0677354 [Tanacetum coccineum]|uniref:Uncharacterized protein n=1 Tax=Tanacetum coccineum TaxID=301880 RepID=A0ABQ4XBY3_9ASTR